MAFPTGQARATGRTTAANVTSHPVTMPSGIVAGELLLVLFSTDGTPTCTDGSGLWTKLGQVNDAAVNCTAAIFHKIAAGSDTLTVTTSVGEQSSHISHRISGASGVVTAASAVTNGIASANSNPPNHTPPAGAKDYLWIACRTGDSTPVATVAPTNYGNLLSIAAAGTAGASSSVADRLLNAASDDPGAFTSASEDWVCLTLAIEPAAGPVVVRRRLGPNFRR